jgi:hypothetical protein
MKERSNKKESERETEWKWLSMQRKGNGRRWWWWENMTEGMRIDWAIKIRMTKKRKLKRQRKKTR